SARWTMTTATAASNFNAFTLGGYPCWLQGADNPVDAAGQTLPLLFQLDSEEKAGIMWGDTGLVYVFYDPQRPGHFTFDLQCL
ncbi:DUF1963 domain-containing protein, partial [Hymenobacter glaciei]|uniref:DUF1963 domain-containing protein n=1 Tax=Hymenobacter glaciei TaxID=877209 RepID=UPI0031F15C60